MRPVLFLLSGIFIGFWLSWPGIIIPKNWRCFKEIISKSQEKKISVKAALSVPPNYLLKGKNKGSASKLRIVSDACFR